MSRSIKTPALAAAITGSLVLAGTAFAATPLAQGYMLGAHDHASAPAKTADGKAKAAEGKCGEGKRGATTDAKSKGVEGKCGEGTCGAKADASKPDAKKAPAKGMEGKCGEGKCGGAA